MFSSVRGETSRLGTVRTWCREDDQEQQRALDVRAEALFSLEEVNTKRGKDRPVMRNPRNRAGLSCK